MMGNAPAAVSIIFMFSPPRANPARPARSGQVIWEMLIAECSTLLPGLLKPHDSANMDIVL
jgi:hypothetical protein